MIIMGLDPAQLRDWSALAVVDMQIKQLDSGKGRAEYSLLAMGRKQGLPYDQIVDWAAGTWRRPEFNTREPPEFILDSTGVGIAVKDMLKTKGVPVRAVTITAGEVMTRAGSIIHLGKARLIGTFLAAFDSGKVRINPSMPIWEALQQELLNYRAEISAQGRAKFEAAEGEHDDLLFSLALAVWYGEEIKRGNKL